MAPQMRAKTLFPLVHFRFVFLFLCPFANPPLALIVFSDLSFTSIKTLAHSAAHGPHVRWTDRTSTVVAGWLGGWLAGLVE